LTNDYGTRVEFKEELTFDFDSESEDKPNEETKPMNELLSEKEESVESLEVE